MMPATTAGSDEPPETSTYAFLVTAPLMEAPPWRIPVTAAQSVTLHPADKRQIFLPGEAKVRWLDNDHQVVREERLDIRFFDAVIEETGQHVPLTVSQDGIYTSFRLDGLQVSVQPTHWNEDGSILHSSVSWTVDTQPLSVNLPTTLPDIVGPTPVANYYLVTKPHAQPSYTSYAPDFASRIASAYNWGYSMWQSETSITLASYSIDVLPFNFNAADVCSGGSDSGLRSFVDNWLTFGGTFIGPNAYSLFHGLNPVPSYAGCAYTSRLQSTPGPTEKRASSAITGKDTSGDTYDPDLTYMLGATLHQELTHNAGSGSHTNSPWSCGEINTMISGWPMWCVHDPPFRTSSTQDGVRNYAPSKL